MYKQDNAAKRDACFIEGDIGLGKEVVRVSLMCLVHVNNFS